MLGNLVVGQAGMNQTQYLPLPSGQGRGANQFRHIRPVDDVLDDGFVQGNTDGPAEIPLLLGKLNQAFGPLLFHALNQAVVDQRFENDNQNLAQAQKTSHCAGGAGQFQGQAHVFQSLFAVFDLPEQIGQRDMVAVKVGFQANLAGNAGQCLQNWPGVLILAQTHQGAGPVSTVALIEMVGCGLRFTRRCNGQPTLNGILVPHGVPVRQHGGMGVGNPVQMVVASGEHLLDLGYVVCTQALAAAGLCNLGQSGVALDIPAFALGFQNLYALECATFRALQVMPFPHHLTADPEQELENGQVVQLVLFGILKCPLLNVVGLL